MNLSEAKPVSSCDSAPAKCLPMSVSMTVTIAFLSGQTVPVVVQSDASADELKSRVQHACQVGIRDIVSQQGKLVQGNGKLCDKGIQDGDVLTATVHGTRVVTRFASLEYPTGPAKWGSVFAAIRHDGHVVCWGNQRQGTSYKRVHDKLLHVLEIAATEEAFAATRADGSVVTWGDSEGGGDSFRSARPACLCESDKGDGGCFCCTLCRWPRRYMGFARASEETAQQCRKTCRTWWK